MNTEANEDILDDTSGKIWKKMVDINLTAVVEGAQVAWRHFQRYGNGGGERFIIGTASMAGLLPQVSPVYAATKAAVIQFMRSMAVRCVANGDDHVHCYSLCPSFTDTPLARGDITVDEAGNVIRGTRHVWAATLDTTADGWML